MNGCRVYVCRSRALDRSSCQTSQDEGIGNPAKSNKLDQTGLRGPRHATYRYNRSPEGLQLS